MSKKQGSKSGSPQRRQPKPAPRNPHAISLSPEARRILDEGMAVAGRYESFSRFSRETLVERFVMLITRFGSEMCWAALKEAYSSGDDKKAMYWCDPAFGALAKLGMLKEAQTFMGRLGNDDGQRIAALSMMADFANPETLALILSKIEQIAAQASRAIVRLRGHYNLANIAPERYQHLAPDLQAALRDLCARAEQLTQEEAMMLVVVGMLWPNAESFQRIVLALDCIQNQQARTAGETALCISIARAHREKLNEFADAVSGTSMEARIREMARTARPKQDQADADIANAS